MPVPADYDGDGKTDLAVYRPDNGNWYIRKSSNGETTTLRFGVNEDTPVPADYDGDGFTDIAVFRPSTGNWYMLNSSQGMSVVRFGLGTDIPTQSSYIVKTPRPYAGDIPSPKATTPTKTIKSLER